MDFKVWLEEFVGKGLNGVVFSHKPNTVVKITSNEREVKLAKWLKAHPHNNIARIYSVEKTTNGWKLVLERVNTNFPAAQKLERMRNKAQNSGAQTPTAIVSYLEKHYASEKYVSDIVSALRHVISSGLRLTDFLNPNNMGLANKTIKLFDLQ